MTLREKFPHQAGVVSCCGIIDINNAIQDTKSNGGGEGAQGVEMGVIC